MKKLLCGKIYDTEKAIKLGTWNNGADCGSKEIEESLYRKRTGEFFLFGSGGEATKYAESHPGKGWAAGSMVIPLTWNAADDWAKAHLDEKIYQKYFGPLPDGNKRGLVTVSMSAGAIERAKRAAAKNGMSLSAYIESLI